MGRFYRPSWGKVEALKSAGQPRSDKIPAVGKLLLQPDISRAERGGSRPDPRRKFRALAPSFDKIEDYSNFDYCWKKADWRERISH